MTSHPRLISCDEAGYSGPDLTNDAQPLFAYAAHDLDEAESAELVAAVRAARRRPIQAVELKATALRRRDDWSDVARQVIEAMDGRFIFIVMDKRLSLAAKAYEYVVEPVVERDNGLFYRHGLHRFVAANVHRVLAARGVEADAMAEELERFMRSFEPGDAPSLFGAVPDLGREARVMALLLRFARGYRARIEEGTEHLRRPSAIGKWALDLTSTSLTSLLADGFGKRHPRVRVLCDESEPLLAVREFFDAWIDRDEVVPVVGGTRVAHWRLDMAGPIAFGRSDAHPSLQLADVVAGVAAEVYGPAERNGLGSLRAAMDRHLHANHVLPEDEEGEDPMARANLSVLVELVGRAELRRDPLKGMAGVYDAAIKRFMSPAGRAGRRRGRAPA